MRCERHVVEVSQNGGEYSGHIMIDCVGGIVRGDDSRTIYAGNVRIQFDEDITDVWKTEIIPEANE